MNPQLYDVVDSEGRVCRSGYDEDSAHDVAAELRVECMEQFRVVPHKEVRP